MRIRTRDRFKHVYIPGKTQYGKSTLMFWMVLQDIALGRGVCVMDGKGDFAPKLLEWIPRNRVEDTIYLDINTPVPLDFMDWHGERQKEKLMGELKYLLIKTVEPQHAPLMTANLTDLIYTLLNANENPDIPPHRRATFLDLYSFLEDTDRQTELLRYVTDPRLHQRWKNNFPNLVDRSRITSRMTPFIRSESLRKIFGAPNPKLNIHDILRQKKVLLVNLGPVDDIQRIYGTLVLSKIREAALGQSVLRKSQQRPFFLYCDEFQEFQTSDFPKMLSLAGGLGLSLTLAHQYTDQLEPDILNAITGNVSTFICFRLGTKSANCLRGEIPSMTTQRIRRRSYITNLMEWVDESVPLDPAILISLPVGTALYRAADGSAQFIQTPAPPKSTRVSYAETIRKRTLEKYACDTPAERFRETADGKPNQPDKSENILPGPEPRIPPHHGKKKNA
jgi:TraM recognition site of TraD and TraG